MLYGEERRYSAKIRVIFLILAPTESVIWLFPGHLSHSSFSQYIPWIRHEPSQCCLLKLLVKITADQVNYHFKGQNFELEFIFLYFLFCFWTQKYTKRQGSASVWMIMKRDCLQPYWLLVFLLLLNFQILIILVCFVNIIGKILRDAVVYT